MLGAAGPSIFILSVIFLAVEAMRSRNAWAVFLFIASARQTIKYEKGGQAAALRSFKASCPNAS